jgi:hypothetical protein
MGGKGKSPPPIDPGKSMGEYLFGKGFTSYGGITDPVLQERIIGAEETFRPRYAALELQDIRTFAQGLPAGEVGDPGYAAQEQRVQELQKQLESTPEKLTQPRGRRVRGRGFRKATSTDNPEYARIQSELNQARNELSRMSPMRTREAVPGVFDLLEEQSKRAFDLQQEQLQAQRAADVGALQEFAPQVVEAYRAADPYSAALADAAQQQALGLFGEAEGPLSPERRRLAEQAARTGSLARGRIGDESSIASEILGREQFKAGLRAEARQAGAGAFQQQRAMAGDIGMTLLGRPSAAIQLGGQTLGQATGLASQPMGPQLFDPNVGLNLALQQRGQDLEMAAANAQAGAGVTSGILGAVGTIGGAMIGGPAGAALGSQLGKACWVAREVYGVENPKWLQFREWMLNDAPAWFRNLYIKFGERFAGFISNKPGLKSIIRKWMDTKIK